ncbi:hypothetical protein ON010_g14491 [Phytophthora cinnamomi]|nr:hypothetical protein ON010_g14491 [Phytophthora cinnamomi]
MHDDFRVKLKIDDTGYRVNPWVHVSRLKPRALFPKRPVEEVEVPGDDDFDAALLPEDSWEPDSERDEYEVENILDLRWSKRTRTSRRTREYLVKWKGYDDPEWLPVSQLSCGALLMRKTSSSSASLSSLELREALGRGPSPTPDVAEPAPAGPLLAALVAGATTIVLREATSASWATLPPSGPLRRLDIFVRLATRGLIATYQFGKNLPKSLLSDPASDRPVRHATEEHKRRAKTQARKKTQASPDREPKKIAQDRPDSRHSEVKSNSRLIGLRTPDAGFQIPGSGRRSPMGDRSHPVPA